MKKMHIPRELELIICFLGFSTVVASTVLVTLIFVGATITGHDTQCIDINHFGEGAFEKIYFPIGFLCSIYYFFWLENELKIIKKAKK